MVHITFMQVDSYILKRWWGISSWEAEAGGSFAFETNLAYKGSSKTARATQRSTVTNRQTKPKTKLFLKLRCLFYMSLLPSKTEELLGMLVNTFNPITGRQSSEFASTFRPASSETRCGKTHLTSHTQEAERGGAQSQTTQDLTSGEGLKKWLG